MNKNRALEIEASIKEFVDYGNVPVEDIVSTLQAELLDAHGEIIVDNCSMLKEHTSLSFTFKRAQGIDKAYSAIGVKYGGVAIEFTRIPLK